MRMSEGDLIAWAITAEVLQELDPVDLEFLPDLAETWYTRPKVIGRVPGAFDFDPSVASSTALVVFAVVAPALKGALPKLFEAVIDVGKAALEKIVLKPQEEPLASKPSVPSPQRIHELVRMAALERKLSVATADAIANAVVAKLATAD